MRNTVKSILLGAVFGSILIFSDAFNWYRIQEMFHFDSFHMYGLIGSAIVVAGSVTWLLKKAGVKSASKQLIQTKKKEIRPVGNSIGGLIFGAGWALTGACTAPIFILIGYQWEIGIITLAGAVIGAVLYGILNKKLPL
ncbi:MAG: YeeE/YedE thiosulfate transporter family protein [Crocinitomicaceae bacterium]|nr:YeeE/YedE thiosulfate transporter family protein [Crocinitomicaceae bacterium]